MADDEAKKAALEAARERAASSFPPAPVHTEPVYVQAVDHDPVNRPHHYTSTKFEVIEIIEAFGLGFCLGNVVKYILRHPHKGGLEDLKKARWYLDREISNWEEDK